MRPFIIILLLLVFSGSVIAQNTNQGKVYHTTASALNLRDAPNTEGAVLEKLNRYENLVILEKESNGWVKVQWDGYEGFVSEKYIEEGRADVTSYEVRTGARCRDGTTSSATGRGACSHHGGVSYWLTQTRTSVQIIKE